MGSNSNLSAEKRPLAVNADAFTTKRAFRSTEADPSLEAERRLSKRDWKVLALVMGISLLVRVWGLEWPDSVVFDEVHFGKFARKYIIGRFFFDVHPPLAKMLFAVFAFIGGFTGDNEFDFTNIGDDYIGAHVPYLTMRMLPTLSGLATIALCFATLRASGCRTYVAAVTALILAFENTFVTESRYILLDAPLVFFIALTAYAYKRFENTVSFSKSWFRYLLLTGLGLGATVASKWVGLFTIMWIGLLTIYQLWFIWGDLNVSVPKFMKHFVFRAVFLLGVPAAFYIGMFYLHFFCADNMGDGAELLPRWFQASLKHNNLPADVPADVAFGSTISLRHVDTAGGWLHSHVETYPAGSQQQQVTLYSHLDDNNMWHVENGTADWNPTNSTEPVFLKDGSIIRLMHLATERRLHSHDHRAPVTNQDYIFEVSGYGFEGFDGDLNDNWRVKIVDRKSIGAEGKDHVQALRTYFQLEHTMLGCLLYSKPVKLPSWGFEQQEVSCIRGGKEHNTLWFIESNAHPNLPETTERVSYTIPNFWQKLVALNKAMWNVNKDLTDPHYWESRPSSWVILKRGINMWGQKNRQVYLVGNLPVYWAIAASIAVLVAYKVIRVLWWQHRGGIDFFPRDRTPWALFDHHFGNYALGWWCHLFPSFFMVRQLFLHHYLGSLYFGVLMIGQAMELALSVIKPAKLARTVPLLFLLLVVSWFAWFSPLIYGSPWTKSLCEKSKFFDMDFDCNIFLENRSDYKAQKAEISESRYSAFHGLAAPSVTPTEEGAVVDGEAGAQVEQPVVQQVVQHQAQHVQYVPAEEAHGEHTVRQVVHVVEDGAQEVAQPTLVGQGEEVHEEVAEPAQPEPVQYGEFTEVDEAQQENSEPAQAEPVQQFEEVYEEVRETPEVHEVQESQVEQPAEDF